MSMEINITIFLFNITIVSGFYKYNYSLLVLSRVLPPVLSRVLPRGLSCGLPRGRPSPRGLQGSPLRSPAATWAAKGSACYLYMLLFTTSWSPSVRSRERTRFVHSFSHNLSVLKQKRRPDRTQFSPKRLLFFSTFSTDSLSFCNQFHAFLQPYK